MLVRHQSSVQQRCGCRGLPPIPSHLSSAAAVSTRCCCCKPSAPLRAPIKSHQTPPAQRQLGSTAPCHPILPQSFPIHGLACEGASSQLHKFSFLVRVLTCLQCSLQARFTFVVVLAGSATPLFTAPPLLTFKPIAPPTCCGQLRYFSYNTPHLVLPLILPRSGVTCV